MKRIKRIIGIFLACAIIVISCQKVSFAETFNEAKALNNITFEFFEENFDSKGNKCITVEATSNYDLPVSITITCQFINKTTGELYEEKIERAEYLEKGHSFYFVFIAGRKEGSTNIYYKDFLPIDENHNTTIKVEKGLKKYPDAESVIDKVSITKPIPTDPENNIEDSHVSSAKFKYILTKEGGKQMTDIVFNIKYIDTSTGKVYRRTSGWTVNKIEETEQKLTKYVNSIGNMDDRLYYDKVEVSISMAYYIPGPPMSYH